jgi:hypothetical protein
MPAWQFGSKPYNTTSVLLTITIWLVTALDDAKGFWINRENIAGTVASITESELGVQFSDCATFETEMNADATLTPFQGSIFDQLQAT